MCAGVLPCSSVSKCFEALRSLPGTCGGVSPCSSVCARVITPDSPLKKRPDAPRMSLPGDPARSPQVWKLRGAVVAAALAADLADAEYDAAGATEALARSEVPRGADRS